MKKIQIWLPILFAVVMILGMRIGYKLRENIPSSRDLFHSGKSSSVQEVLDLVRLKYVDPVNTDTLVDEAIESMLAHLDPHSIYIPAANLRDITEDLQGNFEGIGVEFQIIEDTVHIVNVLPEGPSEKAGLHVGDRFLRVGDSAVAGNRINSERIRNLLRGPRGSEVNVSVLRGNATVNTTISRGTIPLYSVDASYMLDSATGYIHLNKFSGTTYEEFMYALENLQKKGMKNLVFDLRNNGGGILGEAVDIVDEFLDENKLIVYTDGTRQERQEFKTKRPGLFEQGALTILVDEGSASASEVVAGAVQDWDRGLVIGRRTFGKGLVQEQYELGNGSALRLTVARYYTPTGRSIQKPYANGRSAYHDEILNRFENGEVVGADTVKAARGEAFKTKGGRVVYGGGGITPDIFVPYDTSGFSVNLSPLFADQAFSKFIYLYYSKNKSYFDQFRSPSEFSSRYTDVSGAWKSLQEYIAEQQIKLPAIPEKDQVELKKRIRHWLARQIWRMQGYYEVRNVEDRTIQRALEEIHKS